MTHLVLRGNLPWSHSPWCQWAGHQLFALRFPDVNESLILYRVLGSWDSPSPFWVSPWYSRLFHHSYFISWVTDTSKGVLAYGWERSNLRNQNQAPRDGLSDMNIRVYVFKMSSPLCSKLSVFLRVMMNIGKMYINSGTWGKRGLVSSSLYLTNSWHSCLRCKEGKGKGYIFLHQRAAISGRSVYILTPSHS